MPKTFFGVPEHIHLTPQFQAGRLEFREQVRFVEVHLEHPQPVTGFLEVGRGGMDHDGRAVKDQVPPGHPGRLPDGPFPVRQGLSVMRFARMGVPT